MTGDRLAHLSLRFDAIYCIALGLLVAVTAPISAASVALSTPLLVAVGVATFLWGGYAWWVSHRTPIRASVRVVMIANIAASAGLLAIGLIAGTPVLAFAAFALAIDVAAFAVSQGVALHRLKGAMTA